MRLRPARLRQGTPVAFPWGRSTYRGRVAEVRGDRVLVAGRHTNGAQPFEEFYIERRREQLLRRDDA